MAAEQQRRRGANHIVISGDAPPGDRPGAVVGDGPRAVRGVESTDVVYDEAALLSVAL